MKVIGTHLENRIPDIVLYPWKRVDDLEMAAGVRKLSRGQQNRTSESRVNIPFPEFRDLTDVLIVTLNVFSKYFINKLKLFSTTEIYESEVARWLLQFRMFIALGAVANLCEARFRSGRDGVTGTETHYVIVLLLSSVPASSSTPA